MPNHLQEKVDRMEKRIEALENELQHTQHFKPPVTQIFTPDDDVTEPDMETLQEMKMTGKAEAVPIIFNNLNDRFC